jgi:hypothetical protein
MLKRFDFQGYFGSFTAFQDSVNFICATVWFTDKNKERRERGRENSREVRTNTRRELEEGEK